MDTEVEASEVCTVRVGLHAMVVSPAGHTPGVLVVTVAVFTTEPAVASASVTT